MPHEVIMPALGMAQETGQIVSWLKSEGDAVRAGDPIMEVETDKATMEVEASHDGFLTGIRAAAGDDVPVGNVVAVITDSADAPQAGNGEDTAPAAQPGPASSAPEPDTSVAPAPAEGKQVIMPALGMAQDTGVIVAWLKAPGDAVAAADPLLEVETDKATMEVEAGHGGYVAELRGHAGDAVPVGDVIAVISTEKPDTARHRALGEGGGKAAASPQAAPSGPETAGAPVPTVADADRPAPRQKSATGGADAAPYGRILASPKARRLAARRGLDLARLAEAGHPQPYHARDIETLAALPSAAPAAEGRAAAFRLTARAEATAFDALHDWLSDVLATTPPAGHVVAVAAAATLREIRGTTDALRIDTGSAVLTDPDIAGLAALEESGGAPDLRVTDLSATRITGIEGGADPVPTLTLTRQNGALELALTAAAGVLDRDEAVALLAGLAARLDDPLRQLL